MSGAVVAACGTRLGAEGDPAPSLNSRMRDPDRHRIRPRESVGDSFAHRWACLVVVATLKYPLSKTSPDRPNAK
jgi:hypothetical protein